MDFIEGAPPARQGYYWLRIKWTSKHPVGKPHQEGVYCHKCSCHPDELGGLPDRIYRGLKSGIFRVTGWIQLPDPSSAEGG